MTLWELPRSGAFIPTWPSVSVFQGLCGRLSDGPPKHVHSPIPRTSGYVSLSGQGAFAEVDASITLSRGDEPGSFSRPPALCRHIQVCIPQAMARCTDCFSLSITTELVSAGSSFIESCFKGGRPRQTTLYLCKSGHTQAGVRPGYR